jgi:hypothetical protein
MSAGKQREFAQRLWARFGPDRDRVAREYADAEAKGEIDRKSNRSNVAPLAYAKRLIRDGLTKGWLGSLNNSTAKSSREESISSPARSERTIRRLHEPFERESEDYVQAVKDWRLAFRPPRVRALLVAESHVAERVGDGEITVKLPEAFEHSSLQLPSRFCRLVYCLGYGESRICSPRPPMENSGTWQFWDLFGAVAQALDPSITSQMPRHARSDLLARLGWKFRVLDVLKQAGVWLEDASVQAIYRSNRQRLVSGRQYDDLLRESFVKHVWPRVATDNPVHVWIVGRGVARALRNLPMVDERRVISQPQDRDAKRYKLDLMRLAEQMRGLPPHSQAGH